MKKISLKSVYESASSKPKLDRSSLRGPGRLIANQINELVDMVADEWESQYDEGNPVQSEYGEEAWEDQVSRAALMLVSEIEEAIERVAADLHNAEFADMVGAVRKSEYVHEPFGGAPKGYGQGE